MITVKRVEFDFPTAKHFPNTPKEELWEVQFERKFRNRMMLWWDKLRNPHDYTTVDTRDTPVPFLIFTIIKTE